jgi:Tfp pilus assembly protein PilO
MKRVRDFLDALGVAGVLAIGVLVACALFYVRALAPAVRELQTQRNSAERVKAPSYRPISSDGRIDRIRQFQELFPPINELSDQVEQLYALARHAKLELQQGEYRLETRGPALTAYRITLPVRGDYAQVRDFVDAVLSETRITSVDGLRFERKKAGDAQLEAQVRLTIYFRAPDNKQSQ